MGIFSSSLSSVRKRFKDTFNRSNEVGLKTASDGSRWTIVRDGFDVISQKAVSATADYPIAIVEMPTQDNQVSLYDTAQGSSAALWVSDAGNWWAVGIDQESASCNCQTCTGCNAYTQGSCIEYQVVGYNADTYGTTGYNPINYTTYGGNLSYNPVNGGNAYTNPTGGGNSYKNPTGGGNSYKNPVTGGNSYKNPVSYNSGLATGFVSGGGNCKGYNSFSYKNKTGGNCTGYNPTFRESYRYTVYSKSGGNTSYNPTAGGNTSYNPTNPGNTAYNPTNPGNIAYNPTSGGNPYYNPTAIEPTGGGNAINGVTVYGNAIEGCKTYGPDVCTSEYTYDCNCQTCYPQYVRVIQSVAGTVSTLYSWLIGTVSSSTVIKSLRVKTSGSEITVKAYSDSSLVSQIGTDLVYTPTGVNVTANFGIGIKPSTYNQGYSIDQVEIERN